jgi:hypothetical protein
MSRGLRRLDRSSLPRSIEECERYLGTHYPGQRAAFTTPEAVRAAYAVAREAERVRAIRLSLGSRDFD